MNKGERESQENIIRLGPVISKAYGFGKEKKIDEAFETLRPYLERDEVPSYFCHPVGWTIYRYVKSKQLQLSPSEAATIFRYYLNFCEHKPDIMHSYIMVLAVSYKKLHNQEFQFIDICRSWGLSNFRDEDYISVKTTMQDGKNITYQSLAVKVATLLYKELKRMGSPEMAKEFMPFFKVVHDKCPDYEFTPFYIANLYALSGDKDTAITMFKNMLVDKQQWYLWKHLGDLLDNTLRFSCYCKSLTMIDKEDYLGDMHLSLSSLLLNDNPEQAAYELQCYVFTYKKNGWKLRSEVYEIKEKLGTATPSHAGKSFYEHNSVPAENFAFSGFPQDEFIYTGNIVNHSGKPRACLNNRRRHLFVKMQITPLLRKANKGDIFLCRYNNNGRDTKVLTLHPTGKNINIEAKYVDSNLGQAKGETKQVEGRVKFRDDKPFAFLNSYFIPPRICQSFNLTNGQFIRAEAIRLQDGRWRVVKILSS